MIEKRPLGRGGPEVGALGYGAMGLEGFPLDDIQCTEGDVDVDLETATITITLAAGERIECVFVHGEQGEQNEGLDDGSGGSGGGLPDSGADSVMLAWIAAGLLLAGFALVSLRRVRRSSL